MTEIRQNPCLACPYRLDVASGVWSADEYDKLPPYDAETGSQPFAPFACHASPEQLCHGWAVCHSHRGQDKALIALRLLGISAPERSKVPLFTSGQEAADHGREDIEQPTIHAREVVSKLLASHKRLRGK